MKTSLFALAAVLGFASPASAGDLPITSQIDAVTVYPHGADITRLAEVKLPGAETTLLLDDLPGSVDPQSVRAEGTGNDVEILSVDTNLLPVSQEATDARRKEFDAKIEKLGDERQTLDQLIADKDAQRKLLLSLADRKLSPTQGNGKDKGIDGEGLRGGEQHGLNDT